MALEARFDKKVEAKMKEMEERFNEKIRAVEAKVGSASRRSGSAPAGGGAFEPGYVEIKGWCTFDDRFEKGISRGEGERLFKEWKDKLPPEVSGLIKRIQLPGIKNHKMKVVLKEKGRDNAMELKGSLLDVFEIHAVRLNGTTPYITIERPPM
eukprot:3085022-Karenia_brevis.AAC.1